MRVPRIVSRLLASAFLPVACGCLGGAATPAYSGPRRPAAEVAMLTCEASITLLGLDGREYSTRALEILPGAHRVEFKVTLRAEELGGAFANERNKDMRRSCRADAKFIAEPGVEYRLVKLSRQRGKKFDPKNRALHYYHEFGVLLVDRELDEVIPDAVSELNCG